MKVTCAWCGQPMTNKELLNDTRKSHAICMACVKKHTNWSKINRRKNVKSRIDWPNACGYFLIAWTVILIIVQTVMWLKR